jgi:hypothetical protein
MTVSARTPTNSALQSLRIAFDGADGSEAINQSSVRYWALSEATSRKPYLCVPRISSGGGADSGVIRAEVFERLGPDRRTGVNQAKWRTVQPTSASHRSGAQS